MKKKPWPLETFVFLIIPAFFIAFFWLFFPSLAIEARKGILKTTLYYSLFGGSNFLLVFLALYLYLVVRLCRFGGRMVIQRLGLDGGKGVPARVSVPVIKSWVYFIAMITAMTLAMSLMGSVINRAPAEKIAEGAARINAWDYAIFGFYPPFMNTPASPPWLWNAVAWFMLGVYHLMALWLSILFLALILGDKTLFRKFVMVFFLSAVIAFPSWYAFPAISPHFMYFFNVLHVPRAPSLEAALSSYAPNPVLKAYLERMRIRKEEALAERGGEEKSYYSLTTFPSMHGAWGIAIAYFGTRLVPAFGFLIIPWAVLNLFASVYTQWHYAVDMIYGAAVGGVAIALVNVLFSRARDPEGHLAFVDVLQADFRAATAFVRRAAANAKRALLG